MNPSPVSSRVTASYSEIFMNTVVIGSKDKFYSHSSNHDHRFNLIHDDVTFINPTGLVESFTNPVSKAKVIKIVSDDAEEEVAESDGPKLADLIVSGYESGLKWVNLFKRLHRSSSN